MINPITPPILWPALARVAGRLRTRVSTQRNHRKGRGEISRLSDRMRRDIGCDA